MMKLSPQMTRWSMSYSEWDAPDWMLYIRALQTQNRGDMSSPVTWLEIPFGMNPFSEQISSERLLPVRHGRGEQRHSSC